MLKSSQSYLIVFASLGLLPSFSHAMSFNELSTITTAYQVIDTRDNAAFNGWVQDTMAENSDLGKTADLEKNGGHFPGAIRIQSAWFKDLDSKAQATLIAKYQLDPSLPTYVYGEDSKALESVLEKANFSQVEQIDGDINIYQGKKEQLANYQDLVPVSWVKDLIEKKPVAHAPNSDYKIVEVAWGPAIKYLVSHIPSALYMNTNDLEAEPLWNKRSDEDLAKLLKSLGIAHDTSVILYGRDQTAAARAASLLMYAGVEDVRLVDGGFDAWESAGFDTEAFKNDTKPKDFGAKIPLHPEYYLDLTGAKGYVKDQQGHSLVSIRSWPEYIGETSGYDYIKPKGRIDGSKWGHGGSDAYHMEDFNNPDNTMISPKIIIANWQDWGIESDQNVSFYCGTGWRASEAFFYAHLMGWKNISVFDGGWFEWSMDEKNPTQTGVLKVTTTGKPVRI